MSWDPDLYHRFATERLRPSADLLARIPLAAPAAIVDLGCGAGESTALLAGRWPEAEITALDNSPRTLARARASGVAARWVEADLTDWSPPAPPALIYSNAVFHWLDDHEPLLLRLLGLLAPGGVLAVQMPLNHAAPSHRCVAETIAAGRWRERLTPLWRERPVGEPETYRNGLQGSAASIEIWETTYHHVLDGDNPVAEWVRATTLSPLLAALEPSTADAFYADCAGRLARAYPTRADGTTILAFRRLFILARTPDA